MYYYQITIAWFSIVRRRGMALLANAVCTWSCPFLYSWDFWREAMTSLTIQIYSTLSYMDVVNLAAVAVYTEFSTIDVRSVILRICMT